MVKSEESAGTSDGAKVTGERPYMSISSPKEHERQTQRPREGQEKEREKRGKAGK